MMMDTKDTADTGAKPSEAAAQQVEATECHNTEQGGSGSSAESAEFDAPAEDAASAEKPRGKAPVPERYRHFKHMPPRSHQWIEKNCGAWVLEAMRQYLLDPDRVFPDWGTRFAVTLKDIGREDVERMGEAEVLYDYVMTSPFWEINYQIRKRLMASKAPRKRTGRGKGGHKSREAKPQADAHAQPAGEAAHGGKETATTTAASAADRPDSEKVMEKTEPTTPVKS